MSCDKITFLTNWCAYSSLLFFVAGMGRLTFFFFFGRRHATPYHAPLYLAQAKGFFKDEGIKVAILEPNDPSVCLVFI
jgi:hypothetical protein